MAWQIQCSDETCGQSTWASEIVDLISNHRNDEGFFLCACGKKGYIYKSFKLQEKGLIWEPYLIGAIPLGYEGESYQPFAFLVSSKSNTPADSVWLSYYKDLREEGGVLKLGYGPGGPPVLEKEMLLGLLQHLKHVNLITVADLEGLLNSNN